MIILSYPQIIKHYNQHMGYVEKADILKFFYVINRKSKKF